MKKQAKDLMAQIALYGRILLLKIPFMGRKLCYHEDAEDAERSSP